MYVPAFNAVDEPTARRMVAAYGAGELITLGPDGYPLATRLPVLWDGDRVLAHLARANEHWRSIAPGTKALVANGPAASALPALNPNQPTHKRQAPITLRTRLCGFICSD